MKYRDAALGALLLIAGAVLAFSVPVYRAQDWTVWVIYGVLALSLTFVWGHGGIFSFGQGAFFGIGAYTYGVASINWSTASSETLSALVAAMVVAAVVAGLLGYFMFYGNVGDVYVAIITLAVSLVLLTVMSSTADPRYHIGSAALGGYNGLVGIPPLTVGGTVLDVNEYFFVCIVIAVLAALFVVRLRRRPFGRIVAGVRGNELRTQLLGYDVRRYKLATFVIGGALAGLAGGLYAAWGLFINPEIFGLQQAALVAIWVLVGGRDSVLGAFVGVLVVQGLSTTLGGSGSDWTPIVLGGVLIVVVLLLPAGLVPSLRQLVHRFVPRSRPRPPVALAPMNVTDVSDLLGSRDGGREPLSLAADDLHKQFGGVKALRGVTVDFPAQTIQCLIGPNGAGKSTCFNLLVGRYAPTSGRVLLGGRDITRLRPDARARRGMGIKLQVPSYFAELTPLENIWLAAYARSRDVQRADRRAVETLSWLGMSSRAHEVTGALSHGEHQWLEIGMVVAGEPVVMLLDEPTAGMTREETMRTAELIRVVADHATVVVVEHDMEFVRALQSPVTMFHEGSVFMTGSIEELRRDERVLDVYLGREVEVDDVAR